MDVLRNNNKKEKNTNYNRAVFISEDIFVYILVRMKKDTV